MSECFVVVLISFRGRQGTAIVGVDDTDADAVVVEKLHHCHVHCRARHTSPDSQSQVAGVVGYVSVKCVFVFVCVSVPVCVCPC